VPQVPPQLLSPPRFGCFPTTTSNRFSEWLLPELVTRLRDWTNLRILASTRLSDYLLKTFIVVVLPHLTANRSRFPKAASSAQRTLLVRKRRTANRRRGRLHRVYNCYAIANLLYSIHDAVFTVLGTCAISQAASETTPSSLSSPFGRAPSLLFCRPPWIHHALVASRRVNRLLQIRDDLHSPTPPFRVTIGCPKASSQQMLCGGDQKVGTKQRSTAPQRALDVSRCFEDPEGQAG